MSDRVAAHASATDVGGRVVDRPREGCSRCGFERAARAWDALRAPEGTA